MVLSVIPGRMALTLSRLDEITPVLNAFITQSEQLIEFSDMLDEIIYKILTRGWAR